MENTMEERIIKKKNKKSKSNLISFEEELVPKHVAEEILTRENENVHKECKKKKRKKRRHEKMDVTEDSVEALSVQEVMEGGHEEESLTKRKKKKKLKNETVSTTNDVNEDLRDTNTPTDSKKTESIRARKRMKYAKLLEEMKLKAEVGLQEKALNYLSKWKHNREEWKFEKLRQIWLQQNMYDPDKVPQEFWDIIVQYFSNSKGKARDVILKEALKLVEENTEDDEDVKTLRARDIIQNLQE